MKFLSMFYFQFFYMPRKVTKTISVAKLFFSIYLTIVHDKRYGYDKEYIPM